MDVSELGLSPDKVKDERFIIGDKQFTVVLNPTRELFLVYEYEPATKNWIPTLVDKGKSIPITQSKARPDRKTPRRDKDLRVELMALGYSKDDAEREMSQFMGEMIDLGIVNKALEKVEGKAPQKREEPQFSDEIKTQAKQILENEPPLLKIIEIVNTRHIGDPVIIALEWLSALSMFVDGFKQLHITLGGRSGSGKSSSGRKTTWAIPKSWCHTIRSLSSKAIYYAQQKGELNPDFNLFFINDVADTPDALGTLKALTDTEDDEPEHWTVVDGEFIKLRVPGKKAVWINSVLPMGDSQLNNRFIHANPDQTKEHHKKRSEFLTDRAVPGSLNAPPEPIFELAQCITQTIGEERCGVVLPMLYQYDFSQMSPRDQEFLISLVAVIAYSNRHRRWKTESGKVIGTDFDFKIGCQLWTFISKYQYTSLPEDAHQILKILPDYSKNKENEGMRISNIMEKTDLSRSVVNRFIWGDKNREIPSLHGLGLIRAQKTGEATTAPWEFWKKSNFGYPQLTRKEESGDLLKRGIQKALNDDNLLVPKSEDEIISYITNTDAQFWVKLFAPQQTNDKPQIGEKGQEGVAGQVGLTVNAQIKSIIQDLIHTRGHATLVDIVAFAEERGINAKDVDESLAQLKEQGEISEPKERYYQLEVPKEAPMPFINRLERDVKNCVVVLERKRGRKLTIQRDADDVVVDFWNTYPEYEGHKTREDVLTAVLECIRKRSKTEKPPKKKKSTKSTSSTNTDEQLFKDAVNFFSTLIEVKRVQNFKPDNNHAEPELDEDALIAKFLDAHPEHREVQSENEHRFIALMHKAIKEAKGALL